MGCHTNYINTNNAMDTIRLEMAMGRNIPDAGKVTDAMFDHFTREFIAPVLEFCTIIDGVGFWKGEQEMTKILYMDIPQSDVEMMTAKFEQIANCYKTAFRQEAVLISAVRSVIEFV